MVSQTSGHGDSRLPQERSRRFFGKVSRCEQLGAKFIADGRDEVLTATRENLRAGATQIKVMAGGGAASAFDAVRGPTAPRKLRNNMQSSRGNGELGAAVPGSARRAQHEAAHVPSRRLRRQRRHKARSN